MNENIQKIGIQESGTYYHVTVLSNFFLGYDKYCRTYSKEKIPNSSYPTVFFLLNILDLHIGANKAKGLIRKLGVPNNELLVIETQIDETAVQCNDITKTNLGKYIDQNWVTVSNVYFLDGGNLKVSSIEEVMAASYQLNRGELSSFDTLRPRSVSILPVASGCQAKCSFCFSNASISADQKQFKLDLEHIRSYLIKARNEGANRAVITGGGEPGLLKTDYLCRLISLCKEYYEKVILITNGYSIVNNDSVYDELAKLLDAGLSILSVSRHHFDKTINAKLMGLEIDSEVISRTLLQRRELLDELTLRWVCVLQKGGIDSLEAVNQYIRWAFQNKVTQICFKELYVSSSTESIYFDRRANNWSYANQVPLSMIVDYAKEQKWELIGTLPWGSPIYRVYNGSQCVSVAAYTEPTVSWELHNRQCRSWNLMADGRCYASLESRHSEIFLTEPI